MSDTQLRRKPLAILVVTADPSFLASALAACADAGTVTSDCEIEAGAAPASALHAEVVARAKAYLERTGQALALTVVHAKSLVSARERAKKLGADAGPLGVLLIDEASTGLEEADVEARIEELYEALAAANVATIRSPYSVLGHRKTPRWASGIHAVPDRLVERTFVAASPWLVRTEQLTAIMDFVERTLERPRNHKAALRDLKVTLGEELSRFLSARVQSDWLLLYYTGSSVTPLIDYLDRHAGEQGVKVLRAANEHGLACGALANHLLHDRPFMCVIGLAMVDEFRGAIANLRAARARGFVVCPETDLGKHFTFQGTISADEDTRAMLKARGVPCVYLDKVETLPERLEEAFRLYDAGQGPVFLLTAQWLLSASDPLPRPIVAPAAPAHSTAVDEPALEKALAIVNRGPARLVWQLSHHDESEMEMILAIAERAGIALVDTLGHPGPTHRGGQPIANHLGLLGLYGYNQRSYAFLHDAAGRMRPKNEHCVFLLKSRASERATLFTPARREAVRMVQVTDRADHVAPDVEFAVVGRLEPFLRRVLARLDVDPQLLAERRAAIAATANVGHDPQNRIPSVPMTNNYFFSELGALVGKMIADGYSYTAVFDVGRSSVSAARAVPRTGFGYAGWYGRALMGDAPASLPILAITEPNDVVAFVGDGGRSIVADPIPAIVDNALAHPERFKDRSVTIFYFSNGTYSGIRSYRERLSARWGGRQMRTVDFVDPEIDQSVGALRIVRRRVVSFDGASLRETLLARGRLNVVTVFLGHNNDDDGFTFVTAGWRRGDSDRT